MSRCTFHAHEGIFQKSKLCFEIYIITGYIAPSTSPFFLQLSASQIVGGHEAVGGGGEEECLENTGQRKD